MPTTRKRTFVVKTKSGKALVAKIANRADDPDPKRKAERAKYRSAQKSIAEAKRSAEVHEGLLRLP